MSINTAATGAQITAVPSNPSGIVDEYGDLTFEQAANAVERCGIAFSTEIVEFPGTCLVFTANPTRFHFQLRWRGVVRVTKIWDHPDIGFAVELEDRLLLPVCDWLSIEYPGAFRILPRTALIFANELHRNLFREVIEDNGTPICEWEP